MSPRPMQHRRESRTGTGGYSLEPDPDWNIYSRGLSNVSIASGLSQNLGAMGMRRTHDEYQMDAGAIQAQWSLKSHHPVTCLANHSHELNRDDPLLNHTFFGCEATILNRDTSMVDFCEQTNGVLTPDISPPTTASPLSERPSSWMPITSDQADQSNFFSKRIKIPASLGANPPVQRSDGVRKKNAKFEIPTGRTIETIDGLIKNADNPELVRELKVQKRLLKNREAALQSRQRKKQHTEVLEAEKESFLKSIEDLQAEIEMLKAAKTTLEAEKKEWKIQRTEAEKRFAQLEADKIRDSGAHNNEISDLCNKVSLLQDTIQNMQSTAQSGGSPLSTVPSITDYGSVTNLVSELPSDMSSIPWNDSNHPPNAVWDNFMMDISVANGNPNVDSQNHEQQQQSQREPSTTIQLQQHPNERKMKAGSVDAIHNCNHKADGQASHGTLSKALMLILMIGAILISVEPKPSSKRGGSKPKSNSSTARDSILQNLSSLPDDTKTLARKTLITLFTNAGLIPPQVDLSVPEHECNPNVQTELNRFVHLANGSWPNVNDIVRDFDALIRGHDIELQLVQLQQQQQQQQLADETIEQELFTPGDENNEDVTSI